ncbi:MAG: hypothetical protein KDB90_00235 [Planctomycetes bacterium]|nr:hypothetical protein [Planctomycetota bacterium]
MRILLACVCLLFAGALSAQPGAARASTVDDVKGLPEDTEAVNLTRTSDDALAALSRLKKLKTIYVTGFGSTVTDEGVKSLGEIATLEVVSLMHCDKLTDACVANLAKLNELNSLLLEGNDNFTDAGLKPLAKLPKLRELTISFCTLLTGSFFADFAPDAPLAIVHATMCGQMTTRAYQALGKLAGIERLDIAGSVPTPEGVKALVALKKLKTLTISGRSFDDACLEQVSNMPALEELRLGDSKATDAGGRSIGRIKTLKNLFMGFTKLGDGTLEGLKGHPALEVLFASQSQVTAEGLVHLKSMPKLIDVGLGGVAVGLAGATALAQCKGLQKLNLHGAAIGDDALIELLALKSLTRLDVSHNDISDDGAAKLAALTALENLDLGQCKQITSKSVDVLQKALPKLRISWDKPRGG